MLNELIYFQILLFDPVSRMSAHLKPIIFSLLHPKFCVLDFIQLEDDLEVQNYF